MKTTIMAGAIVSAIGMTTLALSTQAAQGTERFIVGFKAGKSSEAHAAVAQAGGRVVLDLGNYDALAIEVPATAIRGIQRNPNVSYVEEDAKRFPMAEVKPFGIAMVQADDPSLTQPTSSSPRKVCIIDSGIDAGHPDLNGNVLIETTDTGTGSSLTDENSHGTHVAGTIAAIGGNSEGVVGVNSNGVSLITVKVFGADGWAYSSSLVAAHDECVAQGASITNMSLGGSFKSRTEDRAFRNSPLLNIAAAGNDGNTRNSYPASYSSVISVAAVDSEGAIADFSQQNSEVDIAAPGVAVLSSVPRGKGYESSVASAAGNFESTGMEGAPNDTATGSLVDCGLGETACANAAGAVCLIGRGNISFSDKVLACQSGGGVAAIIYNNTPGLYSGTLGGVTTNIPSVGVSGSVGEALQAEFGTPVTVTLEQGDYAHFDGTSMATPHVAGVAALLWNQPGAEACNKDDIRAAMENTALDLGAPGRDNAYGHGLVQAAAAFASLRQNSCFNGNGGGGNTNEAPIADFSADCTDLTCTFDASNSSDDAGISTWSWNFGDGGADFGETTSHTYNADGSFTVTLTVSDSEGLSDSATNTVSVSSGGTPMTDADGDGYPAGVDCNDNDASINPGEKDRGGRKWGDGIDNDCNGIIDG